MTLVKRWQPSRFANAFASFPLDTWSNFTPERYRLNDSIPLRLDVSETGDAYFVEASIPGVSAEDIEVEIDNRWLKIKASTSRDSTDESERYILRERRYGSFYRALHLPKGVDIDRAETDYENGVLRVKLPTSERNGTRRLEVKTGTTA